MNKSLSSVSRWFSERPKWLQVAAMRIIEKDELVDDDYAEFESLCLQEAEGNISQVSCSFPTDKFTHKSYGSLRLCSIGDIEGVNALAPRNPIVFGKSNFSIIYGKNGSGKSGYVRLLKHICGARNPGALHCNVYSKFNKAQKATIKYERDGQLETHEWTGQGICDDLCSIDIYDTSFGKVFVSSEDEVSYEPPILSFFSTVIKVCEKVANDLDAKASKNPSKKANIPEDIKQTNSGIWYGNISARTTTEDIEKHCSFTDQEEVEVKSLQERLSENDPLEKAKQIRKQKVHVDTLVEDATALLSQLSQENCRRIIAAKKKAIVKKNAAEAAASKVFNGSLFEGIGSDVWKELWEAARKYSNEVAYKDTGFPNVSENSRCVLCHQLLSQGGKVRLLSFESFVKGELQKAAEKAANEYGDALKSLKVVPAEDTIITRLDACGIQKEEIVSKILSSFSELQMLREKLPGIKSEEEIPTFTEKPEWIEFAKEMSRELDDLAKKYDKDAESDNRDKIKGSLKSLLAKKWLSEHRQNIADEVQRLRMLALIQAAKKQTNTKALSIKKGELAEALITDAFVRRFNTELRKLGASRIRVELVKSKVSKGRVLHKIQLRGAANNILSDVLSEGETRIVSIASFLADVTGKRESTPFIFDDPISSLDQEYEEATVKRMIELSQNKQVIVFTHRLSLLGTVKHFAEKEGIKTDVVSIRLADWGTGEPAPIPISQGDIKSALNILMNPRFQDAKKAYESGDFDQAEIFVKSICSDFRTVVERSIENDLLCGVVQRFQRPILTLKVKSLAKLCNADCVFFDSLMTKYSGFEHAQPEEAPIELPKLDELYEDMKALKDWREEYLKRTV